MFRRDAVQPSNSKTEQRSHSLTSTENSTPSKTSARTKAIRSPTQELYGNIVECDLHGWRFDVTTGECFTKKSCSIETYEVVIEDGWIKILV